MTFEHALSVWPVAQAPARFQRRGRYVPEAAAHPGKMLPALARAAILRYSDPGDLVVDPMCGIGTTLVEAIHLGRNAIGVELEPRWVSVAAANVLLARDQGARGKALALRGDARRLGHSLLDDVAGRVSLILTSPPYGPSVHGHVRKTRTGVETFDDRYSGNRDNLAHLPQRRRLRSRPLFSDALREILTGCRVVLAREGRLVLTVRPYRRDGSLIDLPGELLALADTAGFVLEARHAALLCGLRGRELVPRASFFQIQKQRAGVIPRMRRDRARGRTRAPTEQSLRPAHDPRAKRQGEPKWHWGSPTGAAGRPVVTGGGIKRSRREKARRVGQLAIEVTIHAPDATSAADLRERQFAAIVRVLRRAYELRQRAGRAA